MTFPFCSAETPRFSPILMKRSPNRSNSRRCSTPGGAAPLVPPAAPRGRGRGRRGGRRAPRTAPGERRQPRARFSSGNAMPLLKKFHYDTELLKLFQLLSFRGNITLRLETNYGRFSNQKKVKDTVFSLSFHLGERFATCLHADQQE